MINWNSKLTKFFVIGFLVICIFFVLRYLYIVLTTDYVDGPFVVEPKHLEVTMPYQHVHRQSVYQMPKSRHKHGYGLTVAFMLKIKPEPENFGWGSDPNQDKVIFERNHAPNIYYHPIKNYLEVEVVNQSQLDMRNYQTFRLENFPVQSLVEVCIVIDNRKIIFYINKRVVHVGVLDNIPIYEPGDMRVGKSGNNIAGHLGPVFYWNYPLNLNQIQKMKIR